MKLNHCDFPDGLLYDVDNDVWIKVDSDVATVGITSIFAAFAGKLTSIRVKPVGTLLEKGKIMATLESPRYFGVARSPISAVLLSQNALLMQKPKVANDSPYDRGWLASIKPSNLAVEIHTLREVKDVENELEERIQQLRVRCFSSYPDYEMFEIGVECAAVIVKLDEVMPTLQLGDVVHLVSDDATADIEMVRWTDQRGQELLETRKEQNLWHFIVRKKG